jgi:hypothetical protein
LLAHTMSLTACNGGPGLTTGCRATCLTMSAVSLGQLRGVRSAVLYCPGNAVQGHIPCYWVASLQDPLRLHARLDSSFETTLQNINQVV